MITAPVHGISVSKYMYRLSCICCTWFLRSMYNLKCSVYSSILTCSRAWFTTAIDWTARMTGVTHCMLITEDLVVQWVCVQSGCVPNYTTTPSLLLQQSGPRLLSFGMFFSLELPSIVWYRWTFKVKDSSLWVAYSSLNSGCLLHWTLDAHSARLHMQFVSTKVQVFLKINVHKAGAKVYKFVHIMGRELNFPRLVHCSDTACSLALTYTHLGRTWTLFWCSQAVQWLAIWIWN